jgi:general secretion pathway protein J
MTRRRNQAGFTLLELLIAILIVSMIMTTAFAALRIGSRSWEAGYERAGTVGEMRSFAEFLRRQLRQTVAASWQDEDETRIAFTGQRQRVRFVAPAPFEADNVGLITYSLVIDSGPGGSELRLEYAPFDPGATAFDARAIANGIALLTNFDAATFDYYGAVDPDGRESWYPEWPATAEFFPQLVRIRFSARDGSPAWPDLTLPLHSWRIP